jgi:hypothetical protein
MNAPMPTTSSTLLMPRNLIGTALLLLALSALARPAVSQGTDSTKTRTVVTGSVLVTNKGISTIPTFTLGKPAAVFNLAIRRDALSFEPEFRYGLDGKPWSFLFWGRYRLVESEKFRLGVGAHPAVSFRTMPVSINEVPGEAIVARRYLAGEVSPTYSISKNASVGAYYLYSYGVEKNVVKHSHFIALRPTLTGIRLSDQLSLRLAPQVYYLKLGDQDGVYLYGGMTLSRRSLPISLSTIANRPLQTNIPGGDDFIWNVSLTYTID